MGCPQDSALSIHYYSLSPFSLPPILSRIDSQLTCADIAAQQAHPAACFALTAWYLVGSPGVLPQSDTEAYLWAKKAAELGLAKAEYACGYFTEVRLPSLSPFFFLGTDSFAFTLAGRYGYLQGRA
jgi:TPR repeat protein